MGRREVTIYTCDGCRASSTVDRNEPVVGFTRVVMKDRHVWLCTVCYGAVEWVARFQGITVPPKVYGSGRMARLRPGERTEP